MKKRVISITTIVALLSSTTASLEASTSLKGSMESAFGTGKVLTNTTGTSTWKDPSTGSTYYSGGGFEVRFKNDNSFVPWVDARAPSFKAGCSGFSFDAGFASIIDLDGIVDQLSDAGSSLIGGFASSLLYSTPILGDVIAFVKRIADRISAMLANACNLGKALGSAAVTSLTHYAMKAAPDAWIKDEKDTGEHGSALKTVQNLEAKFESGTECMTDANPLQCYGSDKKSKTSKSVIQIAMSKPFNKITPGKQGVASPMVSSIQMKDKNRDGFSIDRTTLKKFLGRATFDSDHNTLTLPTSITNLSSSMRTLVFLSQNQSEGTPAMCKMLSETFNSIGDHPTSDQKAKMVQKVKDSLKKDETPLNLGVPSHPRLYAKGKTNKTLMTDSMFPAYAISGKLFNDSIVIPNDYIYVLNVVTESSGDANKTVSANYKYLCHNANNTIEPTWAGFSTVSAVSAVIDKIANNQTDSNASIAIVSEAAQLAKYLGKKEAIENQDKDITAPSITSRNIALYNNYLLAASLISAIISADSTYDAVTSMQNNSNYGLITSKKSLSLLKKYQDDIGSQLKRSSGMSSFADSFLRDQKEIDKVYEVLKTKRLKGI